MVIEPSGNISLAEMLQAFMSLFGVHHEETVGGETVIEYIDVTGTEKAYDSPCFEGGSTRTRSTMQQIP